MNLQLWIVTPTVISDLAREGEHPEITKYRLLRAKVFALVGLGNLRPQNQAPTHKLTLPVAQPDRPQRNGRK